MSREERDLMRRMAEDAAQNGDHEGAADLYALLAAARPAVVPDDDAAGATS